MTDTAEVAQVWVCNCCSSWTDRPVTYAELLADWGWGWGKAEDDDEAVFCPECQ